MYVCIYIYIIYTHTYVYSVQACRRAGEQASRRAGVTVVIFYPFSQFCEIVFPLRACRNSQKQPSTYFRGGYEEEWEEGGSDELHD